MTGMVYQRVQKAAAWNPQHDTQIKKQHPKIQSKSASSSGLSAQERIDSLPNVPANWMSLDPVMRRIQAKAAAMQLAASQEDESQKTGDSPVLDADAVQMKCSQCEDKVQLHADGETQLSADGSHQQVQLHANGQAGAKSIQQVAAQGFSGSATRLPHLNQIQKSFGINLSHVQAYIGGGAAAACNQMGAAAYASGNQIAFKEAPSVELAAHEAAHVVQQQSGQVQLSGGVGQVGDKYEQHADEVAARVGAGQSAGDLLAEYSNKSAQENIVTQASEMVQQQQLVEPPPVPVVPPPTGIPPGLAPVTKIAPWIIPLVIPGGLLNPLPTANDQIDPITGRPRFPQKQPQPPQRPKPITPPTTAPSGEEKTPGDESTDQDDDKKRKYLYAFGNTTQPRPPRATKDIPVDQEGFVNPQPEPGQEWPKGASTFSDVNKTTLQGHYHKIPLETPMPKGLNVMADGKEVNGPHQATHHTIFPVERMLFLTFSELFLSLPWKYAGRK